MSEQTLNLKERIDSVDALRGLAMFIITITQFQPILRTFIHLFGENFINIASVQLTPNNRFPTIYSLGQPLFVFIVGLVLPFSIKNRLSRTGKKRTYLHIIKRALILFLLGLIAGGELLNMPEYNRTFANIPVYNNVLEYISISYLVCAVLVLNTTTKVQYIVTGGVMLLIWAIFLFIPVPGWQGGRYAKEMNIAIYIENLVLGQHGSHFGQWTGVFNTLGHILDMLLGVSMGRIIFSSREKMNKVKLLFICGTLMILAGYIWSIWFPIMKSHYTSSYILIHGGIATLLLALFYLFIDVWGYKKWAFFFIVFGVNSIAIYMMAHLFDFKLLGNVLIGGLSSLFSPDAEAFIKSITAMAIMWLITYYMYRKKTFIKI